MEPERVISKSRNPAWTTISATALRSLAHQIDAGDASHTEGQEVDTVLAQAAGTSLHLVDETLTLWHHLRPRTRSHQGGGTTEKYKERLDQQLGQLLPTTPAKEVLRIRRGLDRPELALAQLEHGRPEDTCEELIVQSVLDQTEMKPPFESSYPLPIETGDQDSPPFLDPDAVINTWQTQTLPKLRHSAENLLTWRHTHPDAFGATLSDLETGMIVGLPELSITMIVRSLQLTLIRRLDKVTRLDGREGLQFQETDLKSADAIHPPGSGSTQELAEELITYITALAMAQPEGHRHRKRGDPLLCFVDTSKDSPTTLESADRFALQMVAVGGAKGPHSVDFGEEYADVLRNPNAAHRVLSNAEALLHAIQEDPNLAALAAARKKRRDGH